MIDRFTYLTILTNVFQGNWVFKSKYNMDHLIFELNTMKGKPIQKDFKVHMNCVFSCLEEVGAERKVCA